MISQSETGHSLNATNLRHAGNYVLGLGDGYLPLAEKLKVQNILLLADKAEEAMQQVRLLKAEHQAAVKARNDAFNSLYALVSQVESALKASDASEHTLKHLNTLKMKLRGGRVNAVKELSEAEKAAGQMEPRTVSVSQLSFPKRRENYAGVLPLVENDPAGKLLDKTLQRASLKAKLDELDATMEAVSKTSVALSQAMISRDEVLYGPKTGVVTVGKAIKEYVKATFGVSSMQYRKVRGFKFRDQKVRGVKLQESVATRQATTPKAA